MLKKIANNLTTVTDIGLDRLASEYIMVAASNDICAELIRDPVQALWARLIEATMAVSVEELQKEVSAKLDGINRYNPQNIGVLQSYVDVQCDELQYDLEANLTLLKLYQLNPETYNHDTVVKILMKCLMQLPKTDIVLAKCLIDQSKLTQQPLISDVLDLADHLETCHFPIVWEMLAAKKDLLPQIRGFEDAIRNFTCYVVDITYQNIDKCLLVQLLGDISDEQLQAYADQYKWKRMENGSVYISYQEATIKSRNIVEKIDLDNIQDILKSVG